MNSRKKTILAIDDDITILNTIRTVLEGVYELSLAKNTDIAQTILNTATIDLILLDMNMPGSSGMDFLEFIRNNDSYYHIPVIIVSSQGTADLIVEVNKKGAADFVVKPISPSILKEKIRSCLKEASVKTSRMSMEIKLKRLSDACSAGKSDHVEEVIEDLGKVYYSLNVDTEIAQICKYATDMEYHLVDEKIKGLLSSLSE